MRRIPALVALVLTAALCGCGSRKKHAQPVNAELIVRPACEGVGVVKRSFAGRQGAPVLVLEEDHSSRAGQIQHAITLQRLYGQGLLHIALEGYLKEHGRVETDWWARAAGGSGAAVAVRLLQEGEISSAEFMALLHRDVVLHPVERAVEYRVELDDSAGKAPLLYLLKIAQRSLTPEQIEKALRLQAEAQKLEGPEKAKKLEEMVNLILSADEWVRQKAKTLQDASAARVVSAEEQAALMEEIRKRAQSRSIDLTQKEREAMDRNLRFFRGRSAASRTMVSGVSGVADGRDTKLVAMTVGAAHTEGICKLLRAGDRPFAVVRPLVMDQGIRAGNLTFSMLERKYQRLSVYSEGLTETLLRVFPPSRASAGKKPEPVLQQPWLQAKAEAYLFIHRINRAMFGPPEIPGGGDPPYGFGQAEFRGRWVHVDPKQIRVIPDADDSKSRAVLFPLVLYPEDDTRRTTLWVKAGPGMPRLSRDEEENVEAMLKRALDEVQTEQAPGPRAEDGAGRLHITSDTVAGFGRTAAEAMNIRISQI
ncbi:MAG: hypothetical protein AAB654_23450 [Acidobacteriota bacterium]|mgnify:CR=1 FL=1